MLPPRYHQRSLYDNKLDVCQHIRAFDWWVGMWHLTDGFGELLRWLGLDPIDLEV